MADFDYKKIRKAKIVIETKSYVLIDIAHRSIGGIPYFLPDIENFLQNGYELTACFGSINSDQYLFKKRIDENRDWLERQLFNGKYEAASS